MIIYGSNSYAIKSFNLRSLGIKTEDNKTMYIEYRQKYGHIFYVPCFPIRRFWAINISGKLYEPSHELTPLINSLDVKSKNGIWAWTGPLLLAIVLIYQGFTQKMHAANNQHRSEANISLLDNFFKNPVNTAPLKQKIDKIYSITDSAYAAAKYENNNIDTSFVSLYTLYIAAKQTRKDTLKGYNEANTVVYAYINHKHDTAVLFQPVFQPGIIGALKDGKWSGYVPDTASVFKSARKFNEYKYILFVSEYNRINPVLEGKTFSQGFSLANAGVVNIASGKVEKRFKLMAVNSDSVQHFTRTFQGERLDTQRDVEYMLYEDLKHNLIKAAENYVFNTPGPKRQ